MSTERDILVTPEASNIVRLFVIGGIEIVVRVGAKIRIEVLKDGKAIKAEYSKTMEMFEIGRE